MYYITQSTIITNPIGFNIGLTNVDTIRRCFNVGHWRCINVVQRWKSDVGFCFIFNAGSSLFQRSSTTLKQRWSDVEMLAGKDLLKNTIPVDQKTTSISIRVWKKIKKMVSTNRNKIFLNIAFPLMAIIVSKKIWMKEYRSH